jgi:hypothetical protein
MAKKGSCRAELPVAASLNHPGFVVPVSQTRGDRPKQFGKEKAVAFVADFASLELD